MAWHRPPGQRAIDQYTLPEDQWGPLDETGNQETYTAEFRAAIQEVEAVCPTFSYEDVARGLVLGLTVPQIIEVLREKADEEQAHAGHLDREMIASGDHDHSMNG